MYACFFLGGYRTLTIAIAEEPQSRLDGAAAVDDASNTAFSFDFDSTCVGDDNRDCSGSDVSLFGKSNQLHEHRLYYHLPRSPPHSLTQSPLLILFTEKR